jgi:RHS repeat-associated protein
VTPEGTLSYTYYPTGKVETITSSNPHGVSAGYTWDDQNRLSTMVVGGRTQAVESNHSRTVNWSYDAINRLTGETINSDESQNSGAVTYGLDPVGNRTGATSTFSSLSPGFGTYNADDEVSSESYDKNGNTTQTANGNSYTYDSENHMLSMSNASTLVNMIYDAFGNRVAKTVTNLATHLSTTTQYLVEDDVNPTGYPQVVDEIVNGAVTRQYTYGLQRISQNLSPAVTGSSTWTPSFYGYDGGGSVRQLINSLGVVTDEYEYDAFGNSFTKSGTTPNNCLYRGEQFDSDLGLYYLRARYYNPATGRFMSRDPNEPKLRDANGKPIDPRELHKYLYAGGDPVNLKDPTGEATLVEWARSLVLSVMLACGPMDECELPHVELDMEAVYKTLEEVFENYPKDPRWPWWPGSGPL